MKLNHLDLQSADVPALVNFLVTHLELHIGFIVDDPADVRARHAAIAAAGVTISEIEVDGRGTRCYTHAPGPLLVEISSPR